MCNCSLLHSGYNKHHPSTLEIHSSRPCGSFCACTSPSICNRIDYCDAHCEGTEHMMRYAQASASKGTMSCAFSRIHSQTIARKQNRRHINHSEEQITTITQATVHCASVRRIKEKARRWENETRKSNIVTGSRCTLL